MKRTIIISAIFCGFLSTAQNQESSSKNIFVKGNALFLPIGMLNAGVEFQVKEKVTVQADVFISPWKSFAGKYAQVYMAGLEGRYYFQQAFKHWYVGANISGARYIIQKYNYWGNGTYQYTPESPVYNLEDLYQNGFSVMFGATVGYQFQLNDRWNMDLYIGGGSIQSFYKGLHKELGIRYDVDPTRIYNRSGEWLPYKGGVMISYKL